MNRSDPKSRRFVERTYSSASSTTSSRRSGRRKRKRMKHTVMPLKKKPGRHEIPCDVHRVSNLDNEEMEQSACFWVARDPEQSGERSFKEEVFVNRDEESPEDIEDDGSYVIERVRQTRKTDVLMSRTDSTSPSVDTTYTEEKTFYGIRKGTTYDTGESERVSPLPSPRNRSRYSSLSDDSHSAYSSDGTGMHVGWTSDINNSSGPEYSGITDEESEADRGSRRTRRDIRSINDEWEESMEFHGYRRRNGDNTYPESVDSRDQPRSKGQRRRDLGPSEGNQSGIVVAKDVTSFEVNDRVDTLESEKNAYSSRHGFDDSGNLGEDERDFSSGKNIGELDNRVGHDREFFQDEQDADQGTYYDQDVSPEKKPRNDRDGFETQVLEPGYADARIYGRGEQISGRRTSTPTRREYPSSDTELLVERSFDVEVEQMSDRSLPVTHHKSDTKYYSVDELLKSSRAEPSEKAADSGSEGPDVPRGYGEYDRYQPPSYSETREDHLRDKGNSRVDSLTVSGSDVTGETEGVGKGSDTGRDKKIVGAYDSNKERPSYISGIGPEMDEENKKNARPNNVSGTGQGLDKGNKENAKPNEDYNRMTEKNHLWNNERWEESREFFGFRRHQGESVTSQYAETGNHAKPRSRTPLRGDLEHSDRQRRFMESKNTSRVKSDDSLETSRDQRYGSRDGYENIPGGSHTLDQRGVYPGKEVRGTVDEKWEESREFYGYRRRQPLADGDVYPGAEIRDPKYIPRTYQDVYPGGKIQDENSNEIGRPGEEYFEREKDSPLSAGMEDGEPVKTRDYDVNSQRTSYSQQTSKESQSTSDYYYRQTSSETEFRERMKNDTNRVSRYESLQPRDQKDEDYIPKDASRDKHKFTRNQIPSSKNVVPVPSSHHTAGNQSPKPGLQEITETPTKRLHTRSERDTIRRESRRSDPKNDDYNDVGMKMFKQRSLPRKHGHSPVRDGNKELPSKIKKSAEPDLSKSDPEFADKFRQITDKRKKKVKTKHVAKTTDITTKNAVEQKCSKNVDELVNVFTTLESIRKSADSKGNKNVAPGSVKKIVRDRNKLDARGGNDGKLSPATSISQKLQEIEYILDSVDRNNQQRHVFKSTTPSDRRESFQSSEDGRSTRSSESFNETAKFSDYSEADAQNLVNSKTSCQEHETLEEHAARKKYTRGDDRYQDKPRKSGVGETTANEPAETVTKEESMSVECYLESTSDEPAREPSSKHSHGPLRESPRGPLRESPRGSSRVPQVEKREPPKLRSNDRPLSNTDGYPVTFAPYSSDSLPYKPDKRDRRIPITRDDDDEIYRAQIRKARASSWKTRSSRRRGHDSKAYSDGEVEGFRRPFHNRVITPGTPVNIRLYGLNLERTRLEGSQEVDWEPFREWEVPVDEEVRRTVIQRRVEVEEIPGDKSRVEEPGIEKSHVRPGPGMTWNYPPSFKSQKPEPLMSSKEGAPPDNRDIRGRREGKIKWSHAPVSKIRPRGLQEGEKSYEKKPIFSQSGPPRGKSEKPKQHLDISESTNETIRREIEIRSVKRKTPLDQESKIHKNAELPKEARPAKRSPEDLSSEERLPEERLPKEWLQEAGPWEESPSEERLSEDQPSEDQPSKDPSPEKQLSEDQPSKYKPLKDQPSEDISARDIPVDKETEISDEKVPDEHFVPIEFEEICPDEELPEEKAKYPEEEPMDISDDFSNKVPPELWDDEDVVGSSTSKEKPSSEKRREKTPNENRSRINREESSSSEKHETTTRVDHTIQTTRTTRTTRTTTETIVKKTKSSGPDEFTPASRPKEYKPGSSRPDELIPASSEPDGKPSKSAETSLVAHEYIEVNADTGRPVNLTMLGRVVEDDEDNLSSHSREDLFLHTRLKMVTEKKRTSSRKRPEDTAAHLRGPTTAEQTTDGLDYEGDLTDSEHEFDPCAEDAPSISDYDVTEQLLIPISGMKDQNDNVKENVEKSELFSAGHDISSPKTAVDEPISRTTVGEQKPDFDEVKPENVSRDSLEVVFDQPTVDEEEVTRDRVPEKELPWLEFSPGSPNIVTEENIEATQQVKEPCGFLAFDEPTEVNEEVSFDLIKDEGVGMAPVDENVTAESRPGERVAVSEVEQPLSEREEVDEIVSKERAATPSLPEFEQKHVEEKVTSEKRDTDFDIPDFQVPEPECQALQPVDENINAPEPITKDVYNPDFQEIMPEVQERPTPTLVDDKVPSQEKVNREQVIPDFQEIIPDVEEPLENVVDEAVLSQETVTPDQVIPDFQEVMPEFPETQESLPVDENVSSIGKENEEPEIPGFQEVVPEFPETQATSVVKEAIPLEEDTKSVEFPEIQEAVQEPPRNMTLTESDLEVEVPTTGAQSVFTASKPSGFLNIEIINDDVGGTQRRTEYFEVPDKEPETETRVENETSVENKVLTKTRTSETITIEKTVRKNVRYVPIHKDGHEVQPGKGVSFASSPEQKDFSDFISESSSDVSRQSSFGSADASSEADGSFDVANEAEETGKAPGAVNAARRRRNRRGNRFDNIRRSGPLVPESVVTKTDAPETENAESGVARSNPPRTASPGLDIPRYSPPRPVVPRSAVPRSKVSESTDQPTMTKAPTVPVARERPGRLRPEMYLLSDDGGDDGVNEVEQNQEKKNAKPADLAEGLNTVAEKVEGIPEEMPDKMSEMPEKMPEVMAENMPDEVPDKMPEVPDEMPEQMPEEIPEKEFEEMPEKLPDQIPEKESGQMPEQVPDEMPENVPDEMPENVPDEIPEQAPDEMPGNVPDEMPEQVHDEKPGEILGGVTTEGIEGLSTADEEDELSQDQIDELLEKEVQGLPKVDGEFMEATKETEPSVERTDKAGDDLEFEVPSEDALREVTEEISKSVEEKVPTFSDEEDKQVKGEDIEKTAKKSDEALPDEEAKEVREEIEKSFAESVQQSPGVHSEDLKEIKEEIEKKFEKEKCDSLERETEESPDERVDKESEKIEVTLAFDRLPEQEPEKSNTAFSETVPEETTDAPKAHDLDEVPVNAWVDVKNDDSPTSSDDEGISTKQESTVETIIVEKTHSEVSTTITEIMTKRIPSVPTPSSSDDETNFVRIPVDIIQDPEEVDKPCQISAGDVVESEIADEIAEPDDEKRKSVDKESESKDEKTTSDDARSGSDEEKPESNDDKTEPDDGKVKSDETKPNSFETERKEQTAEDEVELPCNDEIDSFESQPNFQRAPEEPASEAETYPKDSDEEISGHIVSVDVSPDEKATVQTLFGIVDIKYEKPRKQDVFVESAIRVTLEPSSEAENSESNERVVAEDVSRPEDVPTVENAFTLECVPTPEEAVKLEDVPTPDEDAASEKVDGMSRNEEEILEIKDGSVDTSYGKWNVIRVVTKDSESQTDLDVISERTQTEETSRTTQETGFMTDSNTLEDSEMQTADTTVCNAATQADFESISQWVSYKKTVEETKLSEETTRISDSDDTRQRLCFDGQTQTDVPVGDFGSQTYVHRTTETCSMTDDNLRALTVTNEGTQTEHEEDGSFLSEPGVTRTIRKSTETRTESSHCEHVEAVSPVPPRDDLKWDCPVCFQSLEATHYSYIKVSDPSRFIAMSDFGAQTENQENINDIQSMFCSSCGQRTSTEEHQDTQEHLRTTVEGWEHDRDDAAGRKPEFCSLCGRPQSTEEQRKMQNKSGTVVDEWGQKVVIQSESSSVSSSGAHFSIRIEGDEKCSLFCRRVGSHSCMLQKLASIIQANRKAATADRGATTSANTQQEDGSETTADSSTASEVEDHVAIEGESLNDGAYAVIGEERCDVSVQTEGAFLPTDFEVFTEKDFEIYYDGQSSPCWTAMTIAQGMQKEHESLIKQLDLLREVNQKLRDQKDAIQAAHEANLERSPAKRHKTVTRQGSTMSTYFATFDGSSGTMKGNPRLSSVNEAGGSTTRSVSGKRKLHRARTSTQSVQSPLPGNHPMGFADEADGAEFESDRVFEEGELKESARPEWMEKIHAAAQPVMNEAEKRKTERQFRERKTNILPQLSVEDKSLEASPKSDQNQSPDRPLSPRTSPVGTETQATNAHRESLSPENPSHLQRVYKVVFVGDSGVGKSSFIHRYCYEIWKPSYTATIGVDFQVKSLEIDRKKLALQLWDTAGQERFRSITKQYFRKADGVVILYDLTSEASFIDIKSWLISVEEAAEPGCTVMLVGNKLDLCKEDDRCRAVVYKDAEQLAEEYGILYAEASAKTGDNVNEAMETLARRLQEQEDWTLHSVLNLKIDESKNKKSKCCGK